MDKTKEEQLLVSSYKKGYCIKLTRMSNFASISQAQNKTVECVENRNGHVNLTTSSEEHDKSLRKRVFYNRQLCLEVVWAMMEFLMMETVHAS
jgi:hypothetical protein